MFCALHNDRDQAISYVLHPQKPKTKEKAMIACGRYQFGVSSLKFRVQFRVQTAKFSLVFEGLRPEGAVSRPAPTDLAGGAPKVPLHPENRRSLNFSRFRVPEFRA